VRHGGGVWNSGNPYEWIDFSANLRPDGPPSWVENAIYDAQKNIRFYPDSDMKRARRGLARFLDFPEECVLPVAGGIAAIDLVLSSSAGCVFIQPPTFSEYAGRAAVYGRPCETWSGKCRKGDTLVICNPNNPTGETRTKPELLSLQGILAADGGELLIDEAFIEYCPEYSMRSYIRPGLIVAGSLSKILGIPGIRLGYICADPETVLLLWRRLFPWPLDAFATEIAAQLPEHMDEIRTDAKLNTARRSAFAKQLTKLGAEVFPSESNFLLVDFHRDMAAAADLLRSRGILVRSCSSFGLPDSCWRLAVRTEADNSRFINELEEILHVR
jgi:histidinol-phosphate/aromatic aminotransferase/cobyric acid decarboxylase-like protein